MKNKELGRGAAGEFKTIGGVKLPLAVWSRANTYKTQQLVQSRKLKLPEAVAELVEKGLTAEGIL